MKCWLHHTFVIVGFPLDKAMVCAGHGQTSAFSTLHSMARHGSDQPLVKIPGSAYTYVPYVRLV